MFVIFLFGTLSYIASFASSDLFGYTDAIGMFFVFAVSCKEMMRCAVQLPTDVSASKKSTA